MFRYEILFLAVPEITKDESETIKNHFSKVIRAHKGTMVSFDRWGKYRLAYPVNKNEYGVYFLIRFEVEKEEKVALLTALKDIFVFKFNNLIVKHIFERLDIKASLEYKRPDSLEDAPQDVDSFLKRHEMEGLIKKGPIRRQFETKDDRKPVEIENEENLDYDEENQA